MSPLTLAASIYGINLEVLTNNFFFKSKTGTFSVLLVYNNQTIYALNIKCRICHGQ